MRWHSLCTPASVARATVVLALCFLAACDKTSSDAGKSMGGIAAPPPDTASDPGANVARRIARAGTLADAVAGTHDALTRGGVAITDFAGTTERAAVAPSPFVVLPTEAVVLAYEARGHASHSHLTLSDLAYMLEDFGWSWDGEGSPSQQMMKLVATWVRAAQRAPNDPLSFTPLFLADMGRRQLPAVNLASDSTDPRVVKLGFLEVNLIAAALTRGLGAPARAAAAIPAGVGQSRLFWNASYGAVMDGGPCADAKQWFGGTLPGQIMGVYGGWGVGEGLESALEGAGLSEANVGKVTSALDAVGGAMKIIKLAELYSTAQIDVQPVSEMPAHRPSPDVEKTATVVARAGIDPKEWEEYQQSLKSTQLVGSVRDCLETAGLPTWADMADIAADAETWRVQWTLGEGSPKHALHQIAGNDWYNMGQRTMRLKRTSPMSAEARYTFKLTEEIADGHQGQQYDGQVQVIAALRTAKAPSVSLLTDAAAGIVGLAKSLTDLGIGWFQTVVTPKSDIMVPITYHDEGVNLYIEDDNDVSIDVCAGKEGCTVAKSPLAIGFGGGERSHHVYAGNIRMDDDGMWRGQVVLTVTGTYSLPDPHAADGLNGSDVENGPQAFAKIIKGLALLADVPKCHGSYSGYQVLAVEGSSVRGNYGLTKAVELKFIPVGHAEDYRTTANCPWELDRVDGFAVVPSRLVGEFGRSITIDPPKPGERRIYRENVNMGPVRGSITTVVGGHFQR
ncbi:MAG TPA: hypothetical protein VIQ74_14270 [Gemmatimonadaceae bacterium]